MASWSLLPALSGAPSWRPSRGADRPLISSLHVEDSGEALRALEHVGVVVAHARYERALVHGAPKKSTQELHVILCALAAEMALEHACEHQHMCSAIATQAGTTKAVSWRQSGQGASLVSRLGSSKRGQSRLIGPAQLLSSPWLWQCGVIFSLHVSFCPIR
jgi:hypothetical protein